MSEANSILIYLNGSRRVLSGEVVLQTLLTYLRQTERLTGSKLACGEGGCGACTVLLSSYCQSSKKVLHRAVNACLLPVAACDGCAVTTIEAVGDGRGGLAPVQAALINYHGSQCGFCTPGIVMSMFALLRQRAAEGTIAQLSEKDVETNFDGNLCRCTGYRPILDAFKDLVRREKGPYQNECPLGEDCCKSKQENISSEERDRRNGLMKPLETEAKREGRTVDREFIFPPELVQYDPPDLNLADERWFRPISLKELLRLKSKYPQSQIIVGNTEIGIEAKFKGLRVPTLLCATHIPELLCINEKEAGVEIGASVTWTQLNSYIDEAVASREAMSKPESTLYETNSLQAIQSQLRWFAGKQIRNMAAIGGNIVTASPISDVNPIWVASGASFVLLNCINGDKRTVAARDFFLSYRKVDMSEDEILLHIFLPWNKSPYDITHAFKVSRRREDDIAVVSCGVRLRLKLERPHYQHDNSGDSYQFRIEHVAISFGGLAPKTITMDVAERFLEGRMFGEESLLGVLKVVSDASKLSRDVPGGMPEFRQSLAVGFVFKAFTISAAKVDSYCNMTGQYSGQVASNSLHIDLEQGNEPEDIHSVSSSVQISSDRQPLCIPDWTGKSVKHLSAALQVTGEAKYLDDITPFMGELQAALVVSTEAHAKITDIDCTEAEKMKGVHSVVTVKDVRGENLFGPNTKDELCFAYDLVTTVGQVIAVVTAESVEKAKETAKAVRVAYERLPSVLTIEEAIRANSFAPSVPDHGIQKGDANGILQTAEELGRVVEGTVRIGGQEHWYLEPQGTIAVPDENGEMLILSSTQAPAKTQEIVAKVIGEPMHKVMCKVKRLGGGFGGKETRSIFLSAAVAVAAQATSRPVRLILDRDMDMLISGTRHPFLAKYKVAYEPSGRIVALQLRIFLNMGNTADLSIPVLDRSLYHAVNCYDIQNVDFVGKACYTHTASATAFRGFGGPQGMMIVENIIEHVSWVTGKPSHLVRDINMFGKGGNSTVTHFGMPFNAEPLLSCWDEALNDSQFHARRREVQEFNRRHKTRKRGISAVPTMFGISFTFKTYNQAGALVHIFHGDGSVLISHGGVEMGQGLHTKVCQVAATVLGIPMEKVFISETATDKVPNASPTAASSSSDMYGMAVKRACEQLLKNLEPARAELGEQASWNDIVHHAWFNRVSLSATGFYRTPKLDNVNLAEPGAHGRPFFYYTNGAAVSEVEIDTITGESRLLRTDIVMDVGRPLNPAIDVGQIEGAFVQGLGWCMMEELVRGSNTEHAWVKPGHTYTLGPSTYKIPGFCDIPKDFRVRVLDTRNEQDTIHSSKAIGEPPLFLAASAFFAVREAIKSSRIENGQNDWFELDSPATVERIRLASIHPIVDSSLPDHKTTRAQLSL